MAAPRAYWRGHVRLALVTFPVRLHAAVSASDRVQLHMIHQPTGKRIRYQPVAEGIGPVERDEIVKGYEVGRGRHVLLDPEEIDALRLESRHTIDLERFVDRDDVDPIHFDRPYYVTPDGEVAEEAYCVIRDALREARKVAIGRVVLSGRERPVAIQACGRGLLLETLRHADEVREAERYFDDIAEREGEADQVAMARQLIEAKTGRFEPERFEDRYQAGLEELIEEKAKGHEIAGPEPGSEARGDNVVDLMGALRASLGDGGGGEEPEEKTPSRGRGKQASGGKAAAKKDDAGGGGESAPKRRRQRKTG